MKQSPDMDRIQCRMQPGEITLHGFLGEDNRKLVDIIAEDESTVASLNLTHAAIADRLKEIMEKGRDLMEGEVDVEKRFTVTVRDDRGLLPSPFGDGLFEKGDCHVLDQESGTEFLFNELTINMIRNHGFYSGKGSTYRISPREASRILNIQPEIDHAE